MPALIKNCGLSTPESIERATETGASFLGFVHHPKSPRHLAPDDIATLFERVLTSIKRVIVLVNPSDALLDSLPIPDFWQIHQPENPERIAAITARTGVPVITGLSLRSRADQALAAAYDPASAHLLFDSYHPQEAGGTGTMFDWSLLTDLPVTKPWFLAGGLTSGNVAEAIRQTGAPMVDVSSGLEDAPGKKSLEKIAAFNRAVLDAS